MDLPSHVTKVTAVAILMAVLLSVLFTTVNTNKKLMLTSIDKSAEMDMEHYNSDYVAYVNTTINGYKLRALLKESVNKDIKIEVRFKDDALRTVTHIATFDYRSNSFATSGGDNADKTRSNFFLVDSSGLEGVDQMISNYQKKGWYIDPFSNFKCSASVTGQQIEALYFDQV